MNKKINYIIISLTFFVLLNISLAFESPKSIEGRVIDLAGNIIAGIDVTVSVFNTNTNKTQKITTKNGEFRFIIRGKNKDEIVLRANTSNSSSQRILNLIGVMREANIVLGEENISYNITYKKPKVTIVPEPFHITGSIKKSNSQNKPIEIINLRTNKSTFLNINEKRFVTVLSGFSDDKIKIIYDNKKIGNEFSLSKNIKYIDIDLKTAKINLSARAVKPQPMTQRKSTRDEFVIIITVLFLLLVGLIFLRTKHKKNQKKNQKPYDTKNSF